MARDSKGIMQFYLPPTHKPHLPLLPAQSITALDHGQAELTLVAGYILR